MKIIGFVVGEEMTVCLRCSKGYRKGYELQGIFEGDWGGSICEICEGDIK
jgi:hypothetical protein